MKQIKKEIAQIEKIINPNELKYFNFHKKRYLQILKEIKIRPNLKILDVGCSRGHMLMILKRKGVNAYGIDYILKEEERFKKEKIIFKKCNIEFDKFPFNDNTFDYIILSEVIEHLVETIDFPLKECKRILKPNGQLIISTPNSCELGKRLLFLFGKNIYFDLDLFYKRGKYERHNREFTMEELKKYLRKMGFKLKKTKFIPSWEGLRKIEKENIFARILIYFQKLIPQFRSNMIIIAEK